MYQTILIEAVIGKAERPIATPNDFEWLSAKIFKETQTLISATTLKRVFGYLKEDVKPRISTLNTLAIFVGHKDYMDFCRSHAGEEETSTFLTDYCLRTEDLKPGDRIRLTWQPDRICVICYLGNNRFRIEEAEKTKLSVGDTFSCMIFINHEPLYLDSLIHDNSAPSTYVIGQKDGIMFEQIP